MKYPCKVCGLIQLMQYEKALIITITKLITFNYNKKNIFMWAFKSKNTWEKKISV